MRSAPQQHSPARPGATARIRLLGQNEPVVAIDACVFERNGQILQLLSDAPLSPATAVRIDVEGGMVLGEVIGWEARPEGCMLAVKIDQVIPSVSELARLVEHVMCESRASDRSRTPRPATA